MRTGITLLFGLILSITSTWGQDYTKVYFDSNDSTRFFYQVAPAEDANGLLILLPGSRGNAEWPLKVSSIPAIAAESGLVTILISYEKWLAWLHDDVLEFLNASVQYVLTQYDIPPDKCVIGGFSGGGNMAISYAELAYEDHSKTAVVPCGVFALDPPIDLVELYGIFHREIEGYYCLGEKAEVTEETLSIHEKMTNYLGTPWDNPDNYLKYSPFLLSDKYGKGGRAIFLKDFPVRVYSGYRYDYFDTKVNNCSLYAPGAPFFISFLRFKGNMNATFKNQYDDDYHPDGGEKYRGRHAWLGFDSGECVDWMLDILEKQ
jgi:hypothetical protein